MHTIDWEQKGYLDSCYHHTNWERLSQKHKPNPLTPCQCVVSRREAGYSGNAFEGYDGNLLEHGLEKGGLSWP